MIDALRTSLTLAIDRYDRTEALIDGNVQVAGHDVRTIFVPVVERHRKMVHRRAYDLCEYPLPAAVADAIDGRPIVSLAIFPYRRFRHSSIYVRDDGPIGQPDQLRGKRIGIRQYSNPATVWARAILHHEGGVAPDQVVWVPDDLDEIPDFRPTGNLKLHAPTGGPAEAALLRGDLEAIVVPELNPRFRHEPRIRRLYPDYWEREIAFCRRTGVFPPMHLIVAKAELMERRPNLVEPVTDAFTESKRIAFARLREPRYASIAGIVPALEAQYELLGPDPWPDGLAANGAALGFLLQAMVDQQILRRVPDLSAIFPYGPEAVEALSDADGICPPGVAPRAHRAEAWGHADR